MFDFFVSFPVRRNLRRASVPALLTAAALAAFAASAQTTGPSQSPLIARAGAQVKPNMMVTVDDSGSMTWSYMPEGVIAVDKGYVAMPNGKYISDVLDEPVITYSEQFQEIWTAPAIPASKQSGYTTYMPQRYLRSPQTNTVYYNPAVSYLPWLKADGTRYPVASYKAAVCDPNNIVTCAPIDLSKTVDMTPNTRYGKDSSGKPKLYPSAWIVKMWTDDNVNSSISTDGKLTLPFDPALFYILTSDVTADPTAAGSYTEYDLNSATLKLPVKDEARKDCAAATCTQKEEQQNFANWFVYYRTRNLMAKGALSESLPAAVKLVRLGWGSINYGGVIRTKVTDLTDSTVLAPILTGIQNFKPGNSTPLRTALDTVGKYFQKTDSDSPWLDTLGDTKSPSAACRRSYSILTTDGYYNDTFKGVGDVDGVAGGVDGIAGRKTSSDNPLNATIKNYQAVAPFAANKQSDMLADVASYYYVNDLQPKIENKVAPAIVDSKSKYPNGGSWQSDIAYWQHLQQFTVGLGVKGTLDASPTLSDGKTPNPHYSLGSLLSPTQSYTNAAGKTVTGTGPVAWSGDHIDDLWHAALNSGGQYFSVRNSVELARAMGDVINQAGSKATGQAGAVASTSQIQTDTLAFVPKYSSGSWTGDLYAYYLDQTTGKPTTVAWQASSAGLVPTYDKRNSWTMASDGSGGQAFKWAGGLDSGNQNLVSTGSQAVFGVPGSEALINYFKGDSSNEGSSGLYRARIRAESTDPKSTTLPDYVDSPPLLVQNFVDAKYGSSIACSGVPYDSYVAGTKATRSTGTIFVGGNGGMLNAFDSKTGKELFDYVPRAGLQKLATVAAKGYGSDAYPHQFFVDGPLLESDACIVNKRSGGQPAWTNLVVGALGAGGSGVFVLDTTSVGSSTPHFDATMPLREWSGVSDADIGDIFSNPQIAMVKGGGWKVITGNGVYSKSGKAALLVLDLSTGAADRVYLGTASNSGAMGVQLVYDGNRQAIGAYVGDIQGNMWRVEFGGPTQADWRVGYGGQPFFKATGPGSVPQPITAVPAVTTNAAGQTVVLFGTGKLYDTTDPDDKNVQSTYGVVDKFAMSQVASGATLTRADLNVQAVTDVNAATSVADNSVSYYYTVAPQGAGTSLNGWLMDLVYTGKSPQIAAGTRVIYPEMVVQAAVFVNAVTPAAVPAECDTALGNGYFFVLDTSTGGQPPKDATWDTNGDGVFDDKDIAGAGVGTSAGGTATQVYKDGKVEDGIYAINSDQGHLWRPPSQSCTTSCTVTDRVWRQILTPPTP